VRRDGIEPPTRGFSVPGEGPGKVEELGDFAEHCPVFVRRGELAIAQLKAVAEGCAEVATELTVRLAEEVLGSSLVRTALAVREGGPLAVARGVQLAELVLRERSAEGARGHGERGGCLDGKLPA
jgi:hypothetical protein